MDNKNKSAILKEIKNRNLNPKDININECSICNECGAVMLPNDESYYEHNTEHKLCTWCCFYDEYVDGYIRGCIYDSHTRLHIKVDELQSRLDNLVN
jgi:hypothetical protein